MSAIPFDLKHFLMDGILQFLSTPQNTTLLLYLQTKDEKWRKPFHFDIREKLWPFGFHHLFVLLGLRNLFRFIANTVWKDLVKSIQSKWFPNKYHSYRIDYVLLILSTFFLQRNKRIETTLSNEINQLLWDWKNLAWEKKEESEWTKER